MLQLANYTQGMDKFESGELCSLSADRCKHCLICTKRAVSSWYVTFVNPVVQFLVNGIG